MLAAESRSEAGGSGGWTLSMLAKEKRKMGLVSVPALYLTTVESGSRLSPPEMSRTLKKGGSDSYRYVTSL